MQTLDLRKQLKHLYQPSAKQVSVVVAPRFQFAMLTGEIEAGEKPGTSPSFAAAMEALYGIAYTLKFMCKLRKEDPIDYPVMALEGLWWVEGRPFTLGELQNPGGWHYQLMVLQPDFITPALFAEGLAQLRKKRGDQPAFGQLRLEAFEEGRCIQVMHLGPYADEPATLARMDAFAAEHGYQLHGRHHEIYLGDPRRAQPEKLKTVLRHPIR
jgi:hypothetical protein